MRGWQTAAILGLVSVALGACQSLPSDQAGNIAISQSMLPEASAMPSGQPESDPPPGFVSFCLRFQDQCQSNPSEAAVVILTDKVWAELRSVNSKTNADIWPADDQAHYGRPEYWTIPTDGYGDCDDYAVTKRQRLARLGLPLKALRVAVVMTPRNNRHAVLTVATDRGDFVLDNQTDEIVAWNQTGYRWLARQDDRNDWGWVALGTTAPTAVATAESKTVR